MGLHNTSPIIILIVITIIIITVLFLWPRYESFTLINRSAPVYTDTFQRLNSLRDIQNVNINSGEFENALVELSRFLMIYRTIGTRRLCNRRVQMARRHLINARIYLRTMAVTNDVKYNDILNGVLRDLDRYMIEILTSCRNGIFRDNIFSGFDRFNRFFVEDDIIIDDGGLIEEIPVSEPVAFNAVPGEIETVDNFLYY